MAKKKLQSGFQLNGIAPNLLLKEIEKTAPFLFQGEIKTDTDKTAYLEKLRYYKKNLKQLNHINLSDYFYLCVSAHWTTAGTFVPTDVDNQIRKGLWQHPTILKHIKKMAQTTIESWKWDYHQVTNRVYRDTSDKIIISTHEGTWLSVAIGAYCALIQNNLPAEANEVASVILEDIKFEENLVKKLYQEKDHLAFLTIAPLIAHNFGDLDRVMVQWDMHESNEFCKSIYKLGHQVNESYSDLLVYIGQVNKAITSNENHRHMALRAPKCLRKSCDFLVPVGPFMDHWGVKLGSSEKLSLSEKAEIIVALFEGFKREDKTLGYARTFKGLIAQLPQGMDSLDEFLSFDFLQEIKTSEFIKIAAIDQQTFERSYIEKLDQFECPITGHKFNS